MRDTYFRKTTLSSVQSQTAINNKILADARKLLDDENKEKREQEQLCQPCFYIAHMATCAVTNYLCGICEKENYWGSGDTPKLCKDCAIKHRLCKRCGGDIELKTRRKL